MKTNPTPLTKELEKQLVGKNVHSVYTLCYECHTWGVNLPLNHQCGNCSSKDTMLYYDIETVAQAIKQELANAKKTGAREEMARIAKYAMDDYVQYVGFINVSILLEEIMKDELTNPSVKEEK